MKKQLSTQFGQSSLLLRSATDVDVEGLLVKKQHSLPQVQFDYKQLEENDFDDDHGEQVYGSTTIELQ